MGDLGCGYQSQVEDCLDADLAGTPDQRWASACVCLCVNLGRWALCTLDNVIYWLLKPAESSYYLLSKNGVALSFL